jgi:hypothetical protein
MKIEKRKLKFISDPGHGWLSVSLADLEKLDIIEKISHFSYMTLTRAYLEEDVDAGIFLKAAKDNNWDISIADSVVETTPIRNYPSYVCNKVIFALNFAIGAELMLFNTTTKDWSIKSKICAIEGNKVLIEDHLGLKYRVSKTRLFDYMEVPINSLTLKSSHNNFK